MKTCLSLLCLSIFLFDAPPAIGEAEQANGSCASAGTTAEMLQCQNLRLQKAEKKLDEVLATLLARRDAAGKIKLHAAQNAWLQFRDADSDFAADEARGGTLSPVIATTVRADITESRAAELRKYLEPK